MSLPRSLFAQAPEALDREWLVTNGIGGFASGTVSQANTRRYHGLLVASLKPPVDRVVMVAKADVTIGYRGQQQANALLAGLAAHLDDACLGSVSEILDGDAPHRPRGCFAQAWSVSETLRAWHLLRTLA